MMIARWHVSAKFGYKDEVIKLMREWEREVGSQTDIDLGKARLITGSLGAAEAELQEDMPIENLSELDGFFDKIATVKLHADWGRKMSEYVVSGSSYWEVFRVVE